jgi:adenylate cyclase
LNAAKYAAKAATWIGATDTSQALLYWQKVRQLMMGEADTPGNNMLRSRASTQIAWVGWKEGVTSAQAKPLIDEALEWARQGDHRMIPILLFLDGRIHIASGGAADYYVERVRQALTLLDGQDIGRRATLNVALSHALGWAGLLREALEANMAALGGISKIEPFDQQFLGYSAAHWAMNLRGRILLRLGRFPEALECFRQMVSVVDLEPTVRVIAHWGSLEIAAALSEPDLALEHASAMEHIASAYPNPYLRVFSLAAQGVAAEVIGRPGRAVRPYSESLALLRASGAAKEYESELIVSLAECHCQLGAHDEARSAAVHALELSLSRMNRLPQCRAHLVLSALAMESNSADGRGRLGHLRQAEQLIELTGAAIYAPRASALRAITPSSVS